MASYPEDIASKLLHSSDARIAEAAKRVFSLSLPPAVAAGQTAQPTMPPPPPSALMDVLDELPIHAHGEMNYVQNNIADGAEQYFQNSSDPGNSTGGNDEVSDDFEECEQKPSSTDRLKRR
jgi:hypothetical protein